MFKIVNVGKLLPLISGKTDGIGLEIQFISSQTVYNDNIFTEAQWPYVPVWLGPSSLGIIITNVSVDSHKYSGLDGELCIYLLIS